MVHALSEIRRVLVPTGVLIDLRPLAANWPVEVVSRRETLEAARVDDFVSGLEDDAAANAAMEQGAAAGWFLREEQEHFPFGYYWESPSDMEQYLTEEWADFASVNETGRKRVRALWAVADADARLRIRLKMLIARWKKI